MLVNMGDVFKVTYIAFSKNKKKRKKVYNFIGLCTNCTYFNFVLNNNFKGENIKIWFDKKSPVIVKCVKLKIYPFIYFRVSKLKFLNKFNSYFDDYRNKDSAIISNLESIKVDYFYSAYLKKKIKRFKKKLRKFKRKYSYTENWKGLKLHKLELKDVNF